MNEQERMEQIFRHRQPAVTIQRPDQSPVPALYSDPNAAPLPRSCQPLERVIISDIHLSWESVARLSLQVVLMSSLVAAFVGGMVWIIAGILHGLAVAMQTMPPPPVR
jgi:hypothetical protein